MIDSVTGAPLLVASVPGISWSSIAADIKQSGAPDLSLMAIAAGASVAAVFTQNAFSAAPVHIAREHLQARNLSAASTASSAELYLLINAGNANAGTGSVGHQAALSCCDQVADATGCDRRQVLPFSTGVIGEPLPVEKFIKVVPSLCSGLEHDGWVSAAEAIMTTDTVPKGATRRIVVDGKTVTLSGICKGAGMIRPNMATMLAFLATDADIAQADLEALISVAVSESFNRITVDGDTSTNDACVLAATAYSNVSLSPSHAAWPEFSALVVDLFVELATAIIRDAEGATKFITIDVVDGLNVEECLQVGYTVAESPLVKTAFFASDANWGRILAAVGRAGVVELEVEKIKIYLDDILICANGGRDSHYREEQGMKVMAKDEINVRIDLNRGAASSRVWTSDLSLDYVHINADYRS